MADTKISALTPGAPALIGDVIPIARGGANFSLTVGNIYSYVIGIITTASVPDSANKRYVTDAQLVVLGNTSGTNTGDQTNITGNAGTVSVNANLTGPVTSVGNATSITNNAVSNAKLAQMNAHTFKGNNTGSASDPIDVTLAQLLTELNLSGTNTGDQTNITGNAGTVTVNANLTGPVTSVGNATTITNDAVTTAKILDANVTYAKIQDVTATNRLLGRSTAGAGDVEEITVGGDLTQAGSAFTIANNAVTTVKILNSAVTLAKIANIADTTILGNNTGGAAAPVALTGAQATSLLAIMVGDSGAGGAKGLVPAQGIGDATKFLRGDATWQTIAGGGDALTSNPLSQFAATTSLQLKGVITDETGSGALVFATSPALVTPSLGVASATSVNKVAVTPPASSATLTIDDGFTLHVTGNVTAFSGSSTGANTGDQAVPSNVISLSFIIDGGGSPITTGVKGYLEIPFAMTITGWTILGDQSGSIVVDVWKDTYANFPPLVADTIAGSEKPTITTATKGQDLTLSTWTTAVSAGDILAFNVDSITTLQRVTLSIRGTKT